MKNPSDPQEPKEWASGLSEPAGFTGFDAEIRANEELLLEALGRPVDAGPQSQADPVELRPEFRAQLRAQFVDSGSERAAGVDTGVDTRVDTALEGRDAAATKLRDWSPEAPRSAFESSLRESFINAEPAAAAHRHKSGRASAQRKPRARTSSTPANFKLVAVGGLLAAAAALLLFFQRPTGSDVPPMGSSGELAEGTGLPEGTGLAGVSDAAGSGAPVAEVPTNTDSGWELDTDFGDEESLLASVRIDGQSVASMREFQSRIAHAERIEVVDGDLRIRHRDEFVIELTAGSAVRLDRWSDQPLDSEGRVLFAESGSFRVATGPGFNPAVSLVVETPHVRTEVVGTIFGLDIGKDYTCVCCLEGAVETEWIGVRPGGGLAEGPAEGLDGGVVGGPATGRVRAGATWVADASEDAPWQGPLVAGHRAPLERLASYWV